MPEGIQLTLTTLGCYVPPPGMKERDKAIKQSWRGASPLWVEAAKEALVLAARENTFLTTDNVWPLILGYETPEPRAMGAIMTWGAREGLICGLSATIPTRRPGSHRRPLRVWRSLVARI